MLSMVVAHHLICDDPLCLHNITVERHKGGVERHNDHGEHSTRLLCDTHCVGRTEQACAMFSMVVCLSTPPLGLVQWVVTEQACAMFSMVVVPLYTTLVSFYSGSSQTQACAMFSMVACASLHHPCVCLQLVVQSTTCAMFSMVAVPLYPDTRCV